MKKVTREWLIKEDACDSGVKYYDTLKTEDTADILERCAVDQEFSHARWLIMRVLSKTKQIQYAVFCAEQVLHLFEENYPDDNRPRLAIEAAKAVIADPSNDNKKAAAYSSAYADAAARAADAAAYAAAYAADAAAYAACVEQIKYAANLIRERV